ncbi:MAG: hypothetical protein E7456_07665 [Ruminococcaceae bacterium]|nr:hypothetical protein [Oscillospiraceae bacterium]
MINTYTETILDQFIESDDQFPTCVYEPIIDGFANPVRLVERYTMGENAAIAYQLEKYDTIGFDCVTKCINNLVSKGAIPESFTAEIPDAFAEQLIPGFIKGCLKGCCSLEIKISNKSTITGTAVGVCDGECASQNTVKSGDRLIGFLSSGLHFDALVKAAEILKLDEENIKEIVPEIFCKMEDELFRRSKIYVQPIMHVINNLNVPLNAVSYTGEKGLINGINKMLPEGVKARIWPEDFPMSGIYELIRRESGYSMSEMFENFNMGIGLVMAVDKKYAGHVMGSLIQMGEHPYVIGCCYEGNKSVEIIW